MCNTSFDVISRTRHGN